MRCLVFACASLCAGCLALAAPVPLPKKQAFRNLPWGRPIDPDQDCKFTYGESHLTIEAPGKPHDLRPGGVLTNSPRITRPVNGGFEAEVQVRGTFRARSAGRNSSPATAGLLYVDKDKASVAFRVEFGVMDIPEWEKRLTALAGMQLDQAGKRRWFDYWLGADPALSDYRPEAPPWEAHLKMVRRSGKLSGYISPDGKRWRQLPRGREDRDLEDPVLGEARVGVALFTLTMVPLKVTFDRFRLTPLPAGAK